MSDCSKCVEFLAASWAHNLYPDVKRGKGAVSNIQNIIKYRDGNITDIETELHRLDDILTDLLKIQCPLEREHFEIGEFSHEFLRAIEKRFPGIKFTLEIIEPADHSQVYTNKNWLKYLMLGLVENAVSALNKKNNQINMVIQNDGNCVLWSVQNKGKPLTRVQFNDRINTRLANQNKKGRGLLIANMLIKFYDGKLELSEIEDGTKIIVILPITDN